MIPLIPKANRSYMSGDFEVALYYYKECLIRLQNFADAPSSLVFFCKNRIQKCKNYLQSLSVNLREEAVSISSTLSCNFDFENWTDTYFYTPIFTEFLPAVSIVIPHYNSDGMIYEALDSIAAQKFHDIETLIVDDKSTDGSLSNELLASYPTWMRLRLVRLRERGGPARSRNIGIRLSEGRGICLLDADDWLDASTLAERWQVVDNDPSVVAAFSSMSYADAERKPLGTVILKGVDSFSYADFTSNKFPCSALLFRRRSLALDPFDESLVYGEDYECFSRIAQRGGCYRLAPGMIWYRQHGNSLTHKDALKDLINRVEITRRVHSRELDWSLVRFTRNLAEALVAEATSMRAFPVACIYALRRQSDKAIQLGAHVDPDLVASKSPLAVAKSIRFFLIREEFQPAEQLSNILAQSDTDGLRQFLTRFFCLRHQHFLSELLQHLLPSSQKASIVMAATASWISCSWEGFICGPGTGGEWRGYVAIHRSDEHMPEEARKATEALLITRPDLEGLFVSRLCSTDNEVLVDVDSIGPADPDAADIRRLGSELTPALVLHELAARSLWAWLIHPPNGADEPLALDADAAIIERRALEGVRALRLKIAGGVAACHVLRNCCHEAAV